MGAEITASPAASPILPAGRIDHPEEDLPAKGGRVLLGGWALTPAGPPDEVLILINGRRSITLPVGGPSPGVGELHPEIPGSERCGWSTWLDLPEAPLGAEISLLARVDSGEPATLRTLDTRRLPAPPPSPGGSRAVFTIAKDEAVFLPIWLNHYSRHFEPADIYVLDHESSDGSTEGIGECCNLIRVSREESFDHTWLRGVVQDFQSFLLRSYDLVLFAEADEMIVADPERYAGLGDYLDRTTATAVTCAGYEVAQERDEPPIDFTQPLLAQRRSWRHSGLYSKRLLTRVPLEWNVGFHDEHNTPPADPDPDLRLLHLHRIDYQYCLERHRISAASPWPEEDVRWNLGWHQRLVDPEDFDNWFYSSAYDRTSDSVEPIPERFRDLL